MLPINKNVVADEGGFTLVEAIVVLGLIAIVVSGLVQLNLTFSKNISSEVLNVRAEVLAVETMEAVRSLRDSNWSNIGNLVPGAQYYLSFSDLEKKWVVEGADSGKIDGIFSRNFIVTPVSRDISSGKIVSSGGFNDSNTLKIEAVVGWSDRGQNKNLELTTYLANF